MKSAMEKDLNGILAFVGVIWIVFLVDIVLPIDLNSYGIVPRTISGLPGILVMPFLHGSLGHLLGNTIPLTVLLLLLSNSRANSVRTVISLVVLSGLLLWCFGRTAVHVGASGLIYAMIAFLIVSGLLERRPVPLTISLLVGFLYGGTLFWGILPLSTEHVSWDGHLLGAIAGGLLAWGTLRRPKKKAAASIV